MPSSALRFVNGQLLVFQHELVSIFASDDQMIGRAVETD
jgi:hypothetical protein